MNTLPLEILTIIAEKDYRVWRGMLVMRIFAEYSFSDDAKRNVLRVFSKKSPDEDVTTLNEKLHSYFDQPSSFTAKVFYWHHRGKLHRGGDKPAYHSCCEIKYYFDGELHRGEDKPARIIKTGPNCRCKYKKECMADIVEKPTRLLLTAEDNKKIMESPSDDPRDDPRDGEEEYSDEDCAEDHHEENCMCSEDMDECFCCYSEEPSETYHWYKYGVEHRMNNLPSTIKLPSCDLILHEEKTINEASPLDEDSRSDFFLEWRVIGRRQRSNGPSVMYRRAANKKWYIEWYQCGALHRDDGPAKIVFRMCDGCDLPTCLAICPIVVKKYWYFNGRRQCKKYISFADKILYCG